MSIIENHLINEDNKIVTSKIENYFENFITSDIKVLLPDYIEQSLYFKKINIEDLKINIQSFIKNYLIQRRNNIRSFIKKESINLSDITNFLKNFILKIQYINNLLKIDHLLIKNSNALLNNLIISDSIILIYIEEQVITFNKDIKDFLLFIKKLDYICYENMYAKTIKLFGNIYKKKIINSEDIPIPINYRRLQKLNNIIKYYHSINNYYGFIKENIIELNLPIFKIILENLIDIIKNNSLEEIEYALVNNWSYIISIKKYHFEEKEDLLNIISGEIIDRCSKFNSIKDIETILKFGKFSSELIRTTFYDKYNIFIAKMSQSIINFFKPDHDEVKVINFINHFIDNSINNYQKNDAITAIVTTNILSNIDIFVNSYYDLLIKRLTNKLSLSICDFEKYINIEKDLVTFIIKIKNHVLLYKLNKIINDTFDSYYENNIFNNLSGKLLKTNISVLTTSYNNWLINQTEGIMGSRTTDIILHTELGKYLKYYELYYVDKYKGDRILNWFPHFGEINITYLDQKFKMLPIHFIIIEMFTDIDEVKINEIINSKLLINYSEKFKTDILNSIIISGLLIIKEDSVIISKNLNITNHNLIDIFMNTSDYPNIWEQMKENELIHSREEITNCVINHILKRISITKSELFEMSKKEIIIFKLNEEIFEKSLKYLIDMDYIILNERDLYEKLF